MSRFADLVIKEDRSEEEARELHILAQQLEYITNDLGTVIGPSGTVARLRAGSVVLDNAGMHTYLGGVETGRIEADGDFFLGTNIAAPATTSLAFFSNAQTYNSESVGSGDLLLGDNTAGKANLLWDLSAGDLVFRSGTTIKAIIEANAYPSITFQRGTGNELARFGAIAVAGNDASAYVMSNIYYTGSAWNLDDTSAPGSIYNSSTSTVAHQFRYAAAGSNPVTPVKLLELYSDGSGFQWNPDQGDHNFQVKGDNDANLIVAEAGIDKVGIGTSTPASKLQVAGATSSATLALSAAGPTDDLDVSGVNTVFVDTSNNNVTLGGTAGGVDGQQLNIVVHEATNNFTIEHNEAIGYKANLISWWSLDEESGARADSHGTNDLADNNTVLYGTGKVGNAADFEDATSESLSVADNADLSTGDIDYSFAGWINTETVPGGGDYNIILGKDENTPNREYLLLLDGDASGQFQLVNFNAGGSVGDVHATTFGTPSPATWYFFYCYHDSVNNRVGISINNGAVDDAATSGVPQDSTSLFRMGANAAVPANFFDGLIDEVGFWKRLLTADERTWLYNSGSGRAYSELASANQEFFLHAGADETMTAEFGGWVFVCDGGEHWHDASHSKHV